MAHPLIPESHREDFTAMLRRRNLSPDDFDLTATATTIAAPVGAVGPRSNTIVVRSKRTGTERAYANSNSISNSQFVDWVNAAAGDVDAGVFAYVAKS